MFFKETKRKYRNKKIVVNGIEFDSQKEYKRYFDLKILERCGVIQNLQMQVPFVLIDKSKYGRAIKYVADFVYTENGKQIVEDVKSEATKTQFYKLKKRLMAERYGIEIKEV